MYTVSETILVVCCTWTMKLKTNIVTKAVENRKNTEQKIKTAEFRRSAEKDHV